MSRYMLTEYQQDAARTINPGLANPDIIRHGVFGLTSEAGEVAGIFQKQLQGHPFEVDHLVKELGDCLWMIAEIATAYGLDMGEIARQNISKLRERYPARFDEWHSMHRRKGDI